MDKDKTVTRQEAITAEKKEKQEAINTYYVQKAIALIRKIQKSARLMIAGVMEKLRRFIIYFQNHNFHRLLIMLKSDITDCDPAQYKSASKQQDSADK